MAAANVITHRSSTRSPTQISSSTIRQAILLLTAFIFGLAVCSAFFLWQTHRNDPLHNYLSHNHEHDAPLSPNVLKGKLSSASSIKNDNNVQPSSSSSPNSSILEGLRVLVTIASFDFMQLAHLEEVLDGFQDLCYAGSKVDIVVYTTVIVSLVVSTTVDVQCNTHIIYIICTVIATKVSRGPNRHVQRSNEM